jgi:excisionase family DNA binding protein
MAYWITTQEAAELSKYHPDHLREIIREGKIHARKFGIVWMVNRQSLLAYVRAADKSKDKRRGPKGR